MIWPFRSKPKKVDIQIAIDKMLALQARKVQPCPDKFKVTGICACMECPARYTCSIEEMARAGGCEDRFIRTCSQKHKLLGENRTSAYGDHISESWIKQLLSRFSGEEVDMVYRGLKKKGLIGQKELGGNDAKKDEDEFGEPSLPHGG